MSAGAADAHQLRVHRWRSHHFVVADHPAPERVQDRVDEALRRTLGSAVASCLERAWPADDGALVFIRHLATDLTIDAARDGEAIAAACARAFVRDLVREVATGTGDNVVRFASRAEYVASYVGARARADSAQRWFFAAFAGWAALGDSAAIRAALVDDPATGRAALAALDGPALAAVAIALDEVDAHDIVRTLAPSAGSADPLAGLRTILLASAPDPLTARVANRPGLLVWLLAHARAGTDGDTVVAAARVLRAIGRASRESDPATLTAAVAAVCADGPRLVALAAGAPEGGPEAGQTAPASAHTRLGGPFLLLDDLAELPLAEVSMDWPSIDGVTAGDLLRLVVLGHCLGATRWTRLFEEPFWRDVWRIGSAIGPTDLAVWLSGLGPGRLRTLRAALAATARDGAEPAPLRAAGVEVAGRVWRVLVGRHGRWAAVGPGGPLLAPSAEAAADDLAYLLDTSGALPERWATLFAVAAQQTLRSFARRLPGFAASRCDYLRRNFLDVAASVQAEPARITVTLSRPPLDLVLSLTGRNRGERRWPDLDARPFVVFTGM